MQLAKPSSLPSPVPVRSVILEVAVLTSSTLVPVSRADVRKMLSLSLVLLVPAGLMAYRAL